MQFINSVSDFQLSAQCPAYSHIIYCLQPTSFMDVKIEQNIAVYDHINDRAAAALP
jgi:hypothetical protein